MGAWASTNGWGREVGGIAGSSGRGGGALMILLRQAFSRGQRRSRAGTGHAVVRAELRKSERIIWVEGRTGRSGSPYGKDASRDSSEGIGGERESERVCCGDEQTAEADGRALPDVRRRSPRLPGLHREGPRRIRRTTRATSSSKRSRPLRRWEPLASPPALMPLVLRRQRTCGFGKQPLAVLLQERRRRSEGLCTRTRRSIRSCGSFR